MDIGSRITLVRGGVSQARFAGQIGVHKNTLGNYERGERTPDADFLGKLAAIGINTHWVITGEGPMYQDDAKSNGNATTAATAKPAEDRSVSYGRIDPEVFYEVIQTLRSDECELRKADLVYLIDEIIAMYNGAVSTSSRKQRQLVLRLRLNLLNQRSIDQSSLSISEFARNNPDFEGIGEGAQEQISKNERYLMELREEESRLKSELQNS